MGIIDYLIRNCLVKSLVYTSIFLVVISLIFLDYNNLKSIEIDTLSKYINSNAISYNIHLILNAVVNAFANSYASTMFIIGLILINFNAFARAIIFRKEINLPYALNLFQSLKRYWWQKDYTKISHDRFERLTHNSIFYKNSISIDISKYENLKEEILQYLKLPAEYEIDVFRYGRKGVQLQLFNLPQSIPFDVDFLEKNKIFFGISKQGKHSIDLFNLTHLGIVGISGSGKSNLLNTILLSVFFNIDKFENIFLIDLKGVELARYEKLNKVTFVDNTLNTLEVLKKLKEIMNTRYKKMREMELLKYQEEYILVVIDEVGTLSVDKKIKEEINTLLIELFQKGRACNIFFHIYGQKFDSTQLSSNILSNLQGSITLKTDSDYNVNVTLGKKELVEKITKVDIDSFTHGRCIFKNGTNSEKTLIQVPYINYDDFKKIIEI
ncbi:FtsK/SpoIIIE domain-containing protein [Aliarcobacter butzleri]|uniref:FtsK/SpoIIIE domain-containing protein n=1 Tax=Aliarcobacter butzleri TaxID=28197 RepID=UPI003B2117A5